MKSTKNHFKMISKGYYFDEDNMDSKKIKTMVVN